MNSLQDCYRILDLEMGATIEEVKRAYRELVRVWHPDRFVHDPVLQRKTQEKLKQINLAYEQICKNDAETPKPSPATDKTETSSTRSRSDYGESQASSSGSSSDETAAPQTPPQDFKESTFGSRFIRFAAFLIVVFFAKLFVSALTQPTHQSVSRLPYIPATPYPAPIAPAPTLTPKPTTVPSVVAKTQEQEEVNHTTTHEGDKTFTVGSSKSQVYAVQGPPKQIGDTQWGYEYSTVYFQNGSVSGWHDPSKILRARLVPNAQMGLRTYFTIGSSLDEVLAAQGSPQHVTSSGLGYEFSTIYFQNGRVSGWHDPSKVLKKLLLPNSQIGARTSFTIGSSIDEVLAAQGTPQHVSSSGFGYEYSTVYFKDAKVSGWHNPSNNLKIR
jgi:hypothetical protein